MPPLTANVPLAPDGVPTIQPPPVSLPHSLAGGGGPPTQEMSAWDEQTGPLRQLVIWICSATTVISPLLPLTELVCWLTMIWPSGMGTTWLGRPLTLIFWPFTTRPSMSTPAFTLTWPFCLQVAAASDEMKSAWSVVIVPSAAIMTRSKLLTEQDDCASGPSPVLIASAVSNVSAPLLTFVSSTVDSRVPPEAGSGPVSQITIGLGKL